MCPSDHTPTPDHDPSDHFDPSISSDAANSEHLSQITNCGVAIREFMLSLMKVSRMDSSVMYGGFVMAVADIFPESFHELARDVALLRSQLPDTAARALPIQYVTAQDIRLSRDAVTRSKMTPTPPKPTPGPFDKFNTAYPDRWPFGCDPVLCMIFHDLVTARHYTTSFTDVTPNVIIKRIHWALNNYRLNQTPTDHPQGWTLPWSADEMRRTLDEMFKVPSLPSGIQKNLCSLTQIFDIYLAQQDTVTKLRKYDMDIANARSSKDRIVARDEKFILLTSSNKSWGNDWTKLFGYEPIPTDHDLSPGPAIEREPTGDRGHKGPMGNETGEQYKERKREAFKKEQEIMNLTSASTDTDDLVELMKLHDDLYGPNWRNPFLGSKEQRVSPFLNSQEGSAITGRKERSDDPVEPYLLSDADRDEMIPKQTPYDPNA